MTCKTRTNLLRGTSFVGAALLACILSACHSDDEPSFWLFADVRPTTLAVEGAPSDVSWAGVRTIPLDQIGRISRGRVWRDTVVGIVDPMSCQVVLVTIHGEEPHYLRRFGRCGEGPGEFRGLTDFMIDGDKIGRAHV